MAKRKRPKTEAPTDPALWHLVVRAADGECLAVLPDLLTAHRCRRALILGAPGAALGVAPATTEGLPRYPEPGSTRLLVRTDWWRIFESGEADPPLLAAFAFEAHARGWHESETAGHGFLFPPGVSPDEGGRPGPGREAEKGEALGPEATPEEPVRGTLAGLPYTAGQLRGTLSLLRYYRAFLRSDKARCLSPEERGVELTRGEARKRLAYLVDCAISRKGLGRLQEGMQGRPWRKLEPGYQVRLYRDQQRLRDLAGRIRVYQFETEEVRKRFGHRLASRED